MAKRLTSKESREMSFSRRKAWLFKKANELSILCGAEVAILAFSLTDKPYSYGHPSFDLIANRFLNGSKDHRHATSSTSLANLTNQERNAIILHLSSKYENCMRILEAERMRKAELDDVLKNTRFSDENLDKLDFGQLGFLEKNLVLMKTEIEKMLEDSKSSYEQQQQYAVGSMMKLPNEVAGGNGTEFVYGSFQ